MNFWFYLITIVAWTLLAYAAGYDQGKTKVEVDWLAARFEAALRDLRASSQDKRE